MRATLLLLVASVLLLVPATAGHALTLDPLGTFSTPMYVTAPPGDAERLFVVERGGAVRIVKNGTKLATPFLTIPSTQLSTDGERGLLAMTFAADYATSGRLYTLSTDAGGDIRVDLWRRSQAPDVADPARALVLRIEHSSRNNHNGGDLQIGPDGLLYISTGDGGGGDDPDNNGQTLIRGGSEDERSTALLGKLLRIAPGADGGYTIPPDNPFAGRADARGEIWAYGLRNPFRFSFDRATGDLLLGDVGQDDAEEVNYAASPARGRGANFGWRCYEGSLPNDGTSPPCTPAGHVAPVFEYDRVGCQSITGGHVVRDPGLPSLVGRYVFGDYCDGVIRSIVPSTGAGDTPTGIDVQDFTLSAFGQDACGRLYVVQLSGTVSRLVDGTASPCPRPADPDDGGGTDPGPEPGPEPDPSPGPAPVPAPAPVSVPVPVVACPAAPGCVPAPLAPSGDADSDGITDVADRCPAAAHRTSDGCRPFVRLAVTSPQRSARTRRLSIRRITSNVSGRVTITGRLRHHGRIVNVRLRAARATLVAGRPASAMLTMSAATRRSLARRLRRGRVEIDVVARLADARGTARVRIRAR